MLFLVNITSIKTPDPQKKQINNVNSLGYIPGTNRQYIPYRSNKAAASKTDARMSRGVKAPPTPHMDRSRDARSRSRSRGGFYDEANQKASAASVKQPVNAGSKTPTIAPRTPLMGREERERIKEERRKF